MTGPKGSFDEIMRSWTQPTTPAQTPATEAGRGRGPETVGAGGWLVEALHRAIRDYSEGPCTGAHLMGYGECQQLAARISQEVEAAARAQALAPERLTAAIMAAVGASHPDDFGIAYRQGGFSPAGLAAAVLALLPPSAEDRHG